jgi:hypothetical protein
MRYVVVPRSVRENSKKPRSATNTAPVHGTASFHRCNVVNHRNKQQKAAGTVSSMLEKATPMEAEQSLRFTAFIADVNVMQYSNSGRQNAGELHRRINHDAEAQYRSGSLHPRVCSRALTNANASHFRVGGLPKGYAR